MYALEIIVFMHRLQKICIICENWQVMGFWDKYIYRFKSFLLQDYLSYQGGNCFILKRNTQLIFVYVYYHVQGECTCINTSNLPDYTPSIFFMLAFPPLHHSQLPHMFFCEILIATTRLSSYCCSDLIKTEQQQLEVLFWEMCYPSIGLLL